MATQSAASESDQLAFGCLPDWSVVVQRHQGQLTFDAELLTIRQFNSAGVLPSVRPACMVPTSTAGTRCRPCFASGSWASSPATRPKMTTTRSATIRPSRSSPGDALMTRSAPTSAWQLADVPGV